VGCLIGVPGGFPFRAIRIGSVTLVAKVYWRIVHY